MIDHSRWRLLRYGARYGYSWREIEMIDPRRRLLRDGARYGYRREIVSSSCGTLARREDRLCFVRERKRGRECGEERKREAARNSYTGGYASIYTSVYLCVCVCYTRFSWFCSVYFKKDPL